MQFHVDITRRMQSGNGAFTLRSRFTASERSLVLFGPSGSGKTLTLRAIAGLLTPDEGCIAVNGEVFFDASSGVNVPTRRRRVGFVFQDYALFPHLTVRDNVAFGLKPLCGGLDADANRRVDELLDIFGLAPLAGLRPSAISGGQSQRTAIARALAPRPRLLLLDEPFNALDQPLRLRMRGEIARVLEEVGIPMVMVTHDPDEAAAFAQTVVVYRHGGVSAVRSAQDLHEEESGVSEMIRAETARAASMA